MPSQHLMTRASLQQTQAYSELSAHVVSIDSDTVLDNVLGVDCSACRGEFEREDVGSSPVCAGLIPAILAYLTEGVDY